ncbi:unnamed protein product [Danaus chrysippus]|uniref:(African queen) hypothetical protein n=1 Tax=Danaus chrysippus TaxID=151541 RepID=A0A8J2QI77_9NEOP|nr:unnamed protein product [Danaus chrysippus]
MTRQTEFKIRVISSIYENKKFPPHIAPAHGHTTRLRVLLPPDMKTFPSSFCPKEGARELAVLTWGSRSARAAVDRRDHMQRHTNDDRAAP